MMDAGPALFEELIDRGSGYFRLQEFDQRFTGDEPGNAGAIGIVEGRLGESEHVAIEGKECVK